MQVSSATGGVRTFGGAGEMAYPLTELLSTSLADRREHGHRSPRRLLFRGVCTVRPLRHCQKWELELDGRYTDIEN